MSGTKRLKNVHQSKTNYPYSFKIKVIRWRLEHHASLQATAKKFRLRNPSQIWQWERVLESGRLKPDKRRWNRTMNKQEQEQDKLKKLEKETELLRIKVTYLEKLEILA